MAPEVASSQGYGLSADTYSFGILTWQVLSLKKPFQYLRTSEKFEQRVYKQGIRPQMEDDWDEDLKNLISDCWAHEKDARPSMEHVKSLLFTKKNESKMKCGEKKFTRRSVRRMSMDFGSYDRSSAV